MRVQGVCRAAHVAPNLMPAVHPCWMHFVRFSSESYMRWDCASATLYTLAVSSWFDDSQARHETIWLRHHRPLKKQELMRRQMSTRGYMSTSEARRVFPSTFSLSHYLAFSRIECTAGITLVLCSIAHIAAKVLNMHLRNALIRKPDVQEIKNRLVGSWVV